MAHGAKRMAKKQKFSPAMRHALCAMQNVSILSIKSILSIAF